MNNGKPDFSGLPPLCRYPKFYTLAQTLVRIALASSLSLHLFSLR
jgi:hypothetical protein